MGFIFCFIVPLEMTSIDILVPMDLKSFIRNIPDFPQKGIIYRDITPLLLNPKAVAYCLDKLMENLQDIPKIDKIVGIESRGFFFSALLAHRLNVGLVPVRKAGKLPSKVIQANYDLEYGKDKLEMHQDAIQKGDCVLVHDDVLATGGTARAACQLVEQLGGKVVQCNFLIELEDLKGKQLLENRPIFSLMKY